MTQQPQPQVSPETQQKLNKLSIRLGDFMEEVNGLIKHLMNEKTVAEKETEKLKAQLMQAANKDVPLPTKQ